MNITPSLTESPMMPKTVDAALPDDAVTTEVTERAGDVVANEPALEAEETPENGESSTDDRLRGVSFDDVVALESSFDEDSDQNAAKNDEIAPTEKYDSTGFGVLGVPANLLPPLERMGFTEPTPVQAATIPPLLEGRDVIGVARTGTGKTAAFALPLLNTIDDAPGVQALVLTPTRELAIQVAGAIASFAADRPAIEVVAVYGGSAYGPQLKALRSGAQVVVGTPGRVIDHLDRERLDLSGVRFIVLDEADEMLRMGFAEDVDRICSEAPHPRQTALFSATMPPPIRRIGRTHLVDPVEVAVSADEAATVDTVHQLHAVVPRRFKRTALIRFLTLSQAEAAVVFTRTRAGADEVGTALATAGFRTATLSGDVPQKEREAIIERTRQGLLQVLVATDVAARGLDIPRLGLVVNYDLPSDAESYVHRVGRTGRAGRSGVALSLIAPPERSQIRAIAKKIGAEITETPVPTSEEVREAQVERLLERVTAHLDHPLDGPLKGGVRRYLAHHDPVEVMGAMASLLLDGANKQRDRRDDEELDRELARHAARMERTPAARSGGGSSRPENRGKKQGKAPYGKQGRFYRDGSDRDYDRSRSRRPHQDDDRRWSRDDRRPRRDDRRPHDDANAHDDDRPRHEDRRTFRDDDRRSSRSDRRFQQGSSRLGEGRRRPFDEDARGFRDDRSSRPGGRFSRDAHGAHDARDEGPRWSREDRRPRRLGWQDERDDRGGRTGRAGDDVRDDRGARNERGDAHEKSGRGDAWSQRPVWADDSEPRQRHPKSGKKDGTKKPRHKKNKKNKG
jgi:ATP-dependent RNA helicase DeaD